MTKKDLGLITLLVALVAIYICFFTTWFKPKTMKIFYTTSKVRAYRSKGNQPFVLFGLPGNYKLTEIKVVPLSAFQNNAEAPPLWHLVSDSNSMPVQRFMYGQRIRGMRPAFNGAEPEALETNVTYLLEVSAGKIKGSEPFKIQ